MRFLPPAPLRQECGCILEGDDSHVGICVSLGRKYREDVPISEQPSEDHCIWHRLANAYMYGVFDGHGGVQCSRVAATLLEEYRTKGVPFVPTGEEWMQDQRDEAIKRGAHQSASLYVDFVWQEFVEMLEKKFWSVLPASQA